MLTEPSKEAVDAMVRIAVHQLDADDVPGPRGLAVVRERVTQALAAALPIERNRWEQEVRERLAERVSQLKTEKRSRFIGIGDRAAFQAAINALEAFAEIDLPAIFGEAEPVEAELVEGKMVCPKCGSPTCTRHGMEPVTFARFREIHSPDTDAAEGEGRR